MTIPTASPSLVERTIAVLNRVADRLEDEAAELRRDSARFANRTEEAKAIRELVSKYGAVPAPEDAELGEEYAPGRFDADRDTDILLRLSKEWTQPDQSALPVADLVEAIWQRDCHAVAPNRDTTPFVTLEEWSAIVKWVEHNDRLSRPAPAWCPIETAPKDGTEIDVWCGNAEFPRRETNVSYRKPTDSEFWVHGSGEPDPKEGTIGTGNHWMDDLGWPLTGADAPTHWMPLAPAPPGKEGQP